MAHNFENEYRILALDDHPVVLEGVQYLLQKQSGVVCTGITTIEELLERLQKGERFHLFILDLELPDSDGFGAFSIIREQCPEASILIYTMHEEPWLLARLSHFDIQGVVSKNDDVVKLIEAVRAIRRGRTYYNEAYSEQLRILQSGVTSYPETMGDAFKLSQREYTVLELISKGLTTPEIAHRLFISTNTVGTYRRRLMIKFNVHNVAQLINKGKKFLGKTN